MSADARQMLHELIDELPDIEIKCAREALAELLARSAPIPGEDPQARVDRRMLETGRLQRIPTREDILNRPTFKRERLSGKMASETLIEDRGE
jgi:hypothetical protein